jgi:hypothetical protein
LFGKNPLLKVSKMENSRIIIKKRNHYMTDEQKKSLSDYMCSNPRLNSGKQLNNYTNRMMKEEWEQLALHLNSIGGANKNGAGWKKSWQDLRRGTKSKAAEMKNHAEGTGGGPSSASLNPIQEKVASLLGNAVIYGHNTVDESARDFTDDDDTGTKFTGTTNDEGNSSNAKILKVVPNPDVISENASTNKRKIKDALENTPASKIAANSDRKLKIKEEYYRKKLELLKRQTVAQEELVQCIKKYFE